MKKHVIILGFLCASMVGACTSTHRPPLAPVSMETTENISEIKPATASLPSPPFFIPPPLPEISPVISATTKTLLPRPIPKPLALSSQNSSQRQTRENKLFPKKTFTVQLNDTAPLPSQKMTDIQGHLDSLPYQPIAIIESAPPVSNAQKIAHLKHIGQFSQLLDNRVKDILVRYDRTIEQEKYLVRF